MQPYEKNIIGKLEWGSTWRLLFLTILTLGIYAAHYIKRQTLIINEYLEDGAEIPIGFVRFLLIYNYFMAAMFVPYLLLLEEGHPAERVIDLLESIWSIWVLMWGFLARKRMNVLLNSSKGMGEWFHGLWTFLFTPLYFNYKINKLNKIV